MDPFTLHLRTRIHFGAGALDHAGEEAKRCAADRPVMVLTGQGSVHRSGVYNKVAASLEAAGVAYFEQPGVEPNPRVTAVRKAIARCRKEDVKLILAVGGGSTIDAAKAIAAGVPYQGDVWDFFTKGVRAKDALAVGAVLTLSATGSEYNGGSVISDWEAKRKIPYVDDLLRPRFSLLDPAATLSVPPRQSAAGVADIFSHILEQYFSPTVATVQDRLAEALLTVCRDRGPITVQRGDDLEARAEIMWASSLALCGLLGAGKVTDWATHMIEHELSARYDLTHGVGLAILTPAWMEQVLDKQNAQRFVRYGHVLWGLPADGGLAVAQEAIARTRDFFRSLGLPTTLTEEGIEDEAFEAISREATAYGPLGGFGKLSTQGVQEILERVR
jgi:alcohol dehydrogenase YqhD (iron-dependent ADH family)